MAPTNIGAKKEGRYKTKEKEKMAPGETKVKRQKIRKLSALADGIPTRSLVKT